MATNKFLLGILCLVISYGNGLFGSSTLEKIRKAEFRGLGFREKVSGLKPREGVRVSGFLAENRKLPTENLTAPNSKLITAIAQSQLGIREAKGKNDGFAVESYLRYTGNKKGDAWCGSFVSWVFGKAGFAQPKTAWSPDLFPLARQTLQPQQAAVFGIYFPSLKRIAHCGLVEKRCGNYIIGIEGNTNVGGNREGDGVYRKRRHIKAIKHFADWLNEPRKEGIK
ncbi:peptidoglycan-binding protein [Pedobacter frigiditerrae]|uniref:peptidoglycan-binding protein n=1 Tax=Pedobacter frigiditerrae TaxID=2530452 RepID=UPI00292FB172|nr:peptidoglycan-binding protein [Pedobacter frigiditerrae]